VRVELIRETTPELVTSFRSRSLDWQLKAAQQRSRGRRIEMSEWETSPPTLQLERLITKGAMGSTIKTIGDLFEFAGVKLPVPPTGGA
jgi:hypothetical protein